jgi:hypothetical protein
VNNRSPVAQSVERLAVNEDVVGSSPTGGANVCYNFIMLLIVPVSEKELKKLMPAIKYAGKVWLKSFLILEFVSLLIFPIMFGIPDNQFIEEFLGMLILFTWPIGLMTFVFSTVLTAYKFKK